MNEEIKYRVVVDWDVFPESPREWDNLGTIYATSRSGIAETVVSNEDEFYGLPSVDEGGVTLEVHMYQHGVTDLRVEGGPRRFWHHEGWDSGHVGYIHATRAAILESFGGKRVSAKKREQARQVLIGEVETLAQYLRGEVYSLNWQEEGLDGSWEDLGGVGGFYLDDEYTAEQAAAECGWDGPIVYARDLDNE